MNYIFYKDEIIPIDEIDRILMSKNTIYVQLKDKDICYLDCDSETEMNFVYDELKAMIEFGGSYGF